MSNKITFYAIVDQGGRLDRPIGLLRRLEYDDGWEDEGLNRDLSWSFTPLIVEWERGSYGRELVVVSHQQASEIVQYFRERFAQQDSDPQSPA